MPKKRKMKDDEEYIPSNTVSDGSASESECENKARGKRKQPDTPVSNVNVPPKKRQRRACTNSFQVFTKMITSQVRVEGTAATVVKPYWHGLAKKDQDLFKAAAKVVTQLKNGEEPNDDEDIIEERNAKIAKIIEEIVKKFPASSRKNAFKTTPAESKSDAASASSSPVIAGAEPAALPASDALSVPAVIPDIAVPPAAAAPSGSGLLSPSSSSAVTPAASTRSIFSRLGMLDADRQLQSPVALSSSSATAWSTLPASDPGISFEWESKFVPMGDLQDASAIMQPDQSREIVAESAENKDADDLVFGFIR